MQLVRSVRKSLLRLDLQEAVGVLRRQFRHGTVLGHHPFGGQDDDARPLLELRGVKVAADLAADELRLGVEQVYGKRDGGRAQHRDGVLGPRDMGGDQPPAGEGYSQHGLRRAPRQGHLHRRSLLPERRN